MSRYNNNRNTTIKYKNAMNNLDKYQYAFDQYDYGLPDENDPEVQDIIAQQMAKVKLEYMDSLPKVPKSYKTPAPQYRAPVVQTQPMVQKRSPLAVFQQKPKKMYSRDYSSLSNETLDDALMQLGLHDFDLDTSNLGIDYSQFRIPRRRISRKSKSQYAKTKVSTKRKTVQKKKKTSVKRKTIQKKKY